MMDSISISPEDSILIITPHPDDESIGCGGLLSLYGVQCDVWLITDGSECGGMENLSPCEKAFIREKEFAEAMKLSRVNSYMKLQIKDGTCSLNLHILDPERIDNYTKIFIPSADEDHIDHRAVYEMACNMVAKNEDCDSSHLDVFCYEISRPMRFYNCFLDISDVVSEKESLIQCHKSQVGNIDYVQAAISLNHFRGILLGNGCQYAEVYRRIDVGLTCEPETRRINCAEKELSKYKCFSSLFSRWIVTDSSNNRLADRIKRIKAGKIAIYGYGVLGKCLLDYLEANEIAVSCIIDRDAFISARLPVFDPDYSMPDVDIIIVTSVFAFDSVKNALMNKAWCDKNVEILNLVDLLEGKV